MKIPTWDVEEIKAALIILLKIFSYTSKVFTNSSFLDSEKFINETNDWPTLHKYDKVHRSGNFGNCNL